MRGLLNVSFAGIQRRQSGGLPPAWSVCRTCLVVSVIGLTPVSSAAKADGTHAQSVPRGASTSAYGTIKPHVEEASRRFLIPSSWIWAVMRAESAGDVRALSNKGAIGLMQIMPKTWDTLRQHHGLGIDPYDPRDNILAGAAYLRELHDRYGARGFLAAYNAGPKRYEDHLSGRRTLPAETFDYVAKVSRRIGVSVGPGDLTDASDGVSARCSDLFPQSNFDPRTDHPADEKRSAVRSSFDQHVVDLSALTPLSPGLFVTLSSH
jgi:Transglycosylase SLT domain